MPKQTLNVSLNFSSKGGAKLPSNGSIRADFGKQGKKGSPQAGSGTDDSDSGSESDTRSVPPPPPHRPRSRSPPRRRPSSPPRSRSRSSSPPRPSPHHRRGVPPMFMRPASARPGYVSGSHTFPPPPPPGTSTGWVPAGSRPRRRPGAEFDSPASNSDSDSSSAASSDSEHSHNSDSDHTTTTKEKKHPSKPKKANKKVTAPVGSISEIKNLYQSRKDRDGNYTWVTTPPKNLYSEPGELANSESDTYAILVRNVKTKGSRKKLQAQSILIQSPLLKTALAEVFVDYPGVSSRLSLNKLSFEAPFRPFVHRWSRLIGYMDQLCNNEDGDGDGDDEARKMEKDHLRLLHDLLKQEIGENLESMEDYVRNGVVTFRHLWMFFEPGCVVVTTSNTSGTQGKKGRHQTTRRAYELRGLIYGHGPNGSECLYLNTDYVDYNGKRFGRYPSQLRIDEFEGTKKISSLEVLPLSHCEDREEVESYLMKRGEKFESLKGWHFRSYKGSACSWSWSENDWGTCVDVDGRIVVDAGSFGRFGEGIREASKRSGCRWTFKDVERFRKYREEKSGLVGDNDEKGKENEEFVGLTPYHRMLTNSRIGGYELKFRKWLEFEVDHISEITFNADVARQLVLPEEQKELILAMAESQIEGESSFDDIIKGKGKGVVCLLSGPPGVGKTLTAEVVAESLHAPLVSLGSGDLGCDASDIEETLLKNLELVARWKGILLLDECDVFLEARAKNDLARNQIVSVFLRVLEYYEGLMFMTTNRIENIDTAFQSRIHVNFEYPNLSIDSRKQIWTKFIESASGCGFKAEVSEQSIAHLARLELNGRQIKNIVKTAQLLAARRKEKVLTRGIIETVLEIEKKRPSMGGGSTSGDYEVLM